MTERNNAKKLKKNNKRLNELVAMLACLCVLVTGYLMMQPALSENLSLENYANKNGGSVSFTLTDTNDSDIPKDDNNNYIVTSNNVIIFLDIYEKL